MIYQVKPKGSFLAAFGAPAVIELASASGLVVDYHGDGQTVMFTDEHGDSEVIEKDDEDVLAVDTDTGAWTLMTLEEFDEVFYIVA
jgi:hypothetical protein